MVTDDKTITLVHQKMLFRALRTPPSPHYCPLSDTELRIQSSELRIQPQDVGLHWAGEDTELRKTIRPLLSKY